MRYHLNVMWPALAIIVPAMLDVANTSPPVVMEYTRSGQNEPSQMNSSGFVNASCTGDVNRSALAISVDKLPNNADSSVAEMPMAQSPMLWLLRNERAVVNSPVSDNAPNMSVSPIKNRRFCMLAYCKAIGTRFRTILSLLMSGRLNTSLMAHMNAKTHSPPKNGGSRVILWNVGINQSPPIPTTRKMNFCQFLIRLSSPWYTGSVSL